MKAKDLMRKKVITVFPDQTVREAARVFIDNKISGAPVVDRGGALIGVVSQTDLVRHAREHSAASVPSYYREGEQWARSEGFQLEDPDLTRVADVMTPAVLSAEESTPAEELARCMLKRRIHRLVITRRGRLRGIVTSMDLLAAFLREKRP